MPTLESLRLARAKAICGFIHKECAQGRVDRKQCDQHNCRAVNAARAIEAADAALGVVSVPRAATLEMLQDGHYAARAIRATGISGMTTEAQTRNETAREQAAWSAMLAASPLREKSDGE